MTKTIQFDLVSPEKKLMSEAVVMATIPGSAGEFGVLADHAPLVASVKAGVVSIYRENTNAVSERIFIAGGFADVNGDQCTLLAEQAIPVNDIDVADIQKQLENIATDLTFIEDQADRARLMARKDILLAMQDAVAS